MPTSALPAARTTGLAFSGAGASNYARNIFHHSKPVAFCSSGLHKPCNNGMATRSGTSAMLPCAPGPGTIPQWQGSAPSTPRPSSWSWM